MIPVGDPDRGRFLFAFKGSVVCHSINGVGGRAGPELDTESDGGAVDPLKFAARMWRSAGATAFLPSMEFGSQIDLSGRDLADIAALVSSVEHRGSFSENDVPELIGVGQLRTRCPPKMKHGSIGGSTPPGWQIQSGPDRERDARQHAGRALMHILPRRRQRGRGWRHWPGFPQHRGAFRYDRVANPGMAFRPSRQHARIYRHGQRGSWRLGRLHHVVNALTRECSESIRSLGGWNHCGCDEPATEEPTASYGANSKFGSNPI